MHFGSNVNSIKPKMYISWKYEIDVNVNLTCFDVYICNVD